VPYFLTTFCRYLEESQFQPDYAVKIEEIKSIFLQQNLKPKIPVLKAIEKRLESGGVRNPACDVSSHLFAEIQRQKMDRADLRDIEKNNAIHRSNTANNIFT
jgi:hypothetical protein